MRWTTLIGRLGMVVLMTGLAVGLVSLIPSVEMTPSMSGGTTYLEPEKYDFLYIWAPLTPQSGARISIEANSSVVIYFLNIVMTDFVNWTMTWSLQQFPNLTEPELWSRSRNMTVFNAFLDSRSDAVLFKSDPATTIFKEFYPNVDTYATAIIANPSPSLVQYTYQITQVTSLAPKAKVVLLAEVLIPVGVVLAIPWVYSTRMRKPQLQ